MSATYLVDASVILRMLRGDEPQQSPQATALFKRAEAGEFTLEVTGITAAETAWVLTSFYKVPRPDVANALLKLLGNPGVVAPKTPWLTRALELFRDANVDATDCFLAAFAESEGKSLVSFDKDFRKFAGVRWLTPDKIPAG